MSNEELSHEQKLELLHSLMSQHSLNVEDVAALTKYSVSSVKAWLMHDRVSPRARPIPERAIDLLNLKLNK